MAKPLKYDSKTMATDRAGHFNLRRGVGIVTLLSFIVSLALLVATGLSAAQQDGAEQSEPATPTEPNNAGSGSEEKTDTLKAMQNGPLVVPVYPRGIKTKDAPVSTGLRDSYIIMKDGSALSVADWILGSLTKNDTGIDMSDYENRLFLGQVARAMVGMDEDLVHHSFVDVRPTITFSAPPPPGAAMQALQGVVGLVGGAIFSGTPEGWHPAKTGGAFSPLQMSGGNAAILFEGQFSGAMMHSVEDIRDAGIYQIMLNDAKKAAEAAKADRR